MKNNQKKAAFIVAGSKPWNFNVFNNVIRDFEGEWYYIGAIEELTSQKVKEINPRYIFFLHWSWKVPDEIVNDYECVCFHMTDVPFGRGGSPLQNLIQRGFSHTKLTALRMVQEFDAGPVYMKEDLCLEGNAEEIYIRASLLSANMIKKIIVDNPSPVPQTGKKILFNRRRPAESEIPGLAGLDELHDFLRMLDAETYPRAFLNHMGFRFEFSRSSLKNNCIHADVTITRIPKGEK